MTVPRWVNTKCQPISIRDVLHYLESLLLEEKALDKTFDIGGPDVLTFKQMMLTSLGYRILNPFLTIN
jgi:uncharacterized protein YbjT (DUF2867 family)